MKTNTKTTKATKAAVVNDPTLATVRPIVEALETLFDRLNEKCFAGKLERPVITVSPDTTKGAYGWMTTYRAWSADKTGKADMQTEGYLELNCCSEHLQRPLPEVVGTLLHEMVHLFNILRGVKDTSRNGWYHNEAYRAAAEAAGLNVTKTDKYGWSETTLNDEMLAWLEEQGMEDFRIHRRMLPKKERKTVKNHSIKYQCPCCGDSVRSTKPVSIRCDKCNELMALA